jgi:general secretion pathway protein H
MQDAGYIKNLGIITTFSIKSLLPSLCQREEYPSLEQWGKGRFYNQCEYYFKTGNNSRAAGFTLLELIIVIFLITLILGLSTLFFANMLPSNRFNATVRNISSAMKYTRSLAQIQGRPRAFTIDLDAKKYGTEDRGTKDIPDDMNIKVIDPISGDLYTGQYQFVMHPAGNIEGGTIVVWNAKKTVTIQLDPVVGAVVIK